MKNLESKYLVAVSGGVDSVVLLDMLVHKHKNLIVAHFDHGIRPNSHEDADFVKGLALKYNLPYVYKKEQLDKNSSEDLARQRRYKFLRHQAKLQNATIVTAHHLDDVIETIIINLIRGTGWRGLAVMGAKDIKRPLLNYNKKELLNYAKRNNVKWQEDETNLSNVYTRNVVRRKFKVSEDVKKQLQALHVEQLRLKDEIEKELTSLLKFIEIKPNIYSRYFINNIDAASAHEIIRHITNGQLLPAQIDETVHAIKTFRKGATFEASKNIKVKLDTRFFTL